MTAKNKILYTRILMISMNFKMCLVDHMYCKHLPDHATLVLSVVIADNQYLEQTAVRLPVVAIDGVDWVSDEIQAIGYGMPPQNASPVAVRREMAKRVAVALERNMPRIIEQNRIDSD
jgi:hypothetical protein